MGTVWGIAVGERGDHLPIVNGRAPFPPKEGTEGLTVIGWPGAGDMRMWENAYAGFFAAFQKIYSDQGSKAAQRNAANQLWNFAFEVKEDDLVICPCSSEGYLLIGEVSGPYFANFDALPGKRGDFVHYRPVRWRYVIPRHDPRHSQLNRIGMSVVSKQQIAAEELQRIANSVDA